MDKKRGAAFFDIDGTFFRRQLSFHWMEELVAARYLQGNVLDKVKYAKTAWEQREQPFHHHDRLMVGILISQIKNIPQSSSVAVGKIAAGKHGQHIHLFPREVSGAFRDIGLPTFAISGSPGDIVRPFAQRLGMQGIRATEFVVGEDGRYTGQVREDWLSRENKGDAVQSLAEEHGVDLAESVAVGDTKTDIKMLEKVGYPICYNPNREMMRLVRERRWPVVIERKDVWFALIWRSGGYVECEHFADLLPAAVRKRFLIRQDMLHEHNSKPAP